MRSNAFRMLRTEIGTPRCPQVATRTIILAMIQRNSAVGRVDAHKMEGEATRRKFLIRAGTAAAFIGRGAGLQGEPVLTGDDFFFITSLEERTPTIIRMALGPCAMEDPGSAGVWRAIQALDPHVVLLLGDTPYIDCSQLDFQRARYQDFAAVPDFAALLRTRPLYATWDDHDFGIDDTDGRYLVGER